jgi:quercetin dioxygenase-like cupin family protein
MFASDAVARRSQPHLEQEKATMKFDRKDRSLAKLAAAGAAALVLTLVSSAAFANGCPAGKMVADGQGQKVGATKPIGVTDTVLTTIDLSKEMVSLNDHQLRMRRLVIQPGGVVPWHSHADRPALIYIIQGTVTEYASDCTVPIVHKAGDWSRDADISHWWKNTAKSTVVLISVHIFHEHMDTNPHQM